jgi:hypothetical protein
MSGCGRSDRVVAPLRLALAAIVIVGLMVGGCTPTKPVGKRVLSPAGIACFVANPLEEKWQTEQKGPDFNYRSLSISGLRSQAVEQRVNRRLAAAFEAAKQRGLPPYRGIKVRIPEGSRQISEDIGMYIMGSFNNILSVSISVHGCYVVPGDPVPRDPKSKPEKPPEELEIRCCYSYMDCLNIDLNTGNDIALRELFTDDYAFPDTLNALVGQKLQQGHAAEEGFYWGMHSGHLKLVKPFPGLAAGQCYYLTESGLGLVFDYRTPEFETNLHSAVMHIPWWDFGKHAAVTARFYDQRVGLYTSDAPPIKTLPGGSERADQLSETHEQVGRVWAHVTLRSSTTYPAPVQDLVRLLSVPDQAEIDRLNRAMAALPRKPGGEDAHGYYHLSVNAYPAGRYVSVMRSVYSSVPSPDDSAHRQLVDFYCFDRDAGKEVLFRDIFVPGYDPSPVVKQALRDSVANALAYGEGQHLSRQEKDRLMGDETIDALYRSIRGVALYNASMNLSPEPIMMGNNQFIGVVTIPYRDIGAANLLIFGP